MRSEIPRLFLLPLSLHTSPYVHLTPHHYSSSPSTPSLDCPSPSSLVFPTLPHSAQTHKCTRAAPKQRGKSWPGRWQDPLLVQRWNLRLSTRTRALFLRARRHRKFLARMLVFAHKHFRGRDTHSSKLAWAVSCHCREVHNDNYSLGLYP